ncbi:SH3 domain-containing protein [Xinfangfangia sp. D13-10-4-6]|uniref:SH3 domain-containing protein n=1 Tax=Pseudogemmobacter hezensis TaxID=2737662 RepID=UPI0015518631|nr:SH3 domain-containing protein [Pseudogemmobacter hezensis]NPD17776.1 SH3 domain-containing protein [Pseudogemmobacter hezensis]
MRFGGICVALFLCAVLAGFPSASLSQLMARGASMPGIRGEATQLLAVRNGPGKTYKKLGEFPKGSVLVFLNISSCMNGYCLVQGAGGLRGWILKEGTVDITVPLPDRNDVVGYGVSQNKLNLRSGPSKHDSLISVIPVGQPLHMLKSKMCRNDYCYVETPMGQRGWVLRSPLTIAKY